MDFITWIKNYWHKDLRKAELLHYAMSGGYCDCVGKDSRGDLCSHCCRIRQDLLYPEDCRVCGKANLHVRVHVCNGELYGANEKSTLLWKQGKIHFT